jgi:hypothetical protein
MDQAAGAVPILVADDQQVCGPDRDAREGDGRIAWRRGNDQVKALRSHWRRLAECPPGQHRRGLALLRAREVRQDVPMSHMPHPPAAVAGQSQCKVPYRGQLSASDTR